MDDLSYTYAQGQLTQVTETGNPDYGYLKSGTGFGYSYGKLVSAGGRGIELIEYNELNLPKKILTGEGTIEIVYDAEGVKWYQKTTWAVDPPAQYPTGEEEKIYFRGLEIINGEPTALYHAQGRAVLAPDGSLLRQEYSLRDHLGNTRVVFSDLDADGALDFSPNSSEIVQTNTYYPFGMLIEGMHPIDQADPVQPYRYNGKELTLMGGLYDYGARWYMADLGRWGAVDPLADQFPAWSPYNYTFNNPILLIDPTGMGPEWKPLGDGKYEAESGDSAWSLHEETGISFERANTLVQDQHGPNYVDTDGIEKSNIDPGAVVQVFKPRLTTENLQPLRKLNIGSSSEQEIVSQFFTALATKSAEFSQTGKYTALNLENFFQFPSSKIGTHFTVNGQINRVNVELELPLARTNRTNLNWGNPSWTHSFVNKKGESFGVYTYSKFGGKGYPSWTLRFPLKNEQEIIKIPGVNE